MNNLEVIRILKASTFVDEDGEDYQLEFQEGLNESEIEALAKAFPNQTIDKELIEILKETRGWDGFGPDMIYFDSIGEFGFTELSPHSLTLGHDGLGNFWILDIMEDGTLGKVFFACHDPAVLVVHSQNLNEYLNHLLEFYKKPTDCHLEGIYGQMVGDIWKLNTNCYSKKDFLLSKANYSEFMEKFEGDDWIVADLKDGENGMGFAWGKQGPNQYTERHTDDMIWVIKAKKKGFLSKIFG